MSTCVFFVAKHGGNHIFSGKIERTRETDSEVAERAERDEEGAGRAG